MKSMCPMCLCVKKKKCAFIYFMFVIALIGTNFVVNVFNSKL